MGVILPRYALGLAVCYALGLAAKGRENPIVILWKLKKRCFRAAIECYNLFSNAKQALLNQFYRVLYIYISTAEKALKIRLKWR